MWVLLASSLFKICLSVDSLSLSSQDLLPSVWSVLPAGVGACPRVCYSSGCSGFGGTDSPHLPQEEVPAKYVQSTGIWVLYEWGWWVSTKPIVSKLYLEFPRDSFVCFTFYSVLLYIDHLRKSVVPMIFKIQTNSFQFIATIWLCTFPLGITDKCFGCLNSIVRNHDSSLGKEREKRDIKC